MFAALQIICYICTRNNYFYTNRLRTMDYHIISKRILQKKQNRDLAFQNRLDETILAHLAFSVSDQLLTMQFTTPQRVMFGSMV